MANLTYRIHFPGADPQQSDDLIDDVEEFEEEEQPRDNVEISDDNVVREKKRRTQKMVTCDLVDGVIKVTLHQLPGNSTSKLVFPIIILKLDDSTH